VRWRHKCRDSETGTGFAYAKLSEARSSPRVAQVVRVTQNAKLSGSQKPCPPLAMLASSATVLKVNAGRPGSTVTKHCVEYDQQFAGAGDVRELFAFSALQKTAIKGSQ